MRLGGPAEVHERLLKFLNRELYAMLASAIPTPRTLGTLCTILADPNHSWCGIYGNFCRTLTWDQFMQVLRFSQSLPGGIPQSPLLCRECVEWVQLMHPQAREVLRHHRSPQGVPEEPSFEIYDSDLVAMFQDAPSGGPLPFRNWCRHGGYLGVGIDLAIYEHIDLLRHMTRGCFLPDNFYLPNLQSRLVTQVATAPLPSLNRLLLNLPSLAPPDVRLDLNAALHRRLCLPADRLGVLGMLSARLFDCPRLHHIDPLSLWELVLRIYAEDGILAALDHPSRLLLLRMFLRQVVHRHSPRALLDCLCIDMGQIGEVDRKDFFVELLECCSYPQRTLILAHLGLDEAQNVLPCLRDLPEFRIMPAVYYSGMPIGTLVKYYRAFRLQLPPGERLRTPDRHGWPYALLPPRNIAGITYEMLEGEVRQRLSSEGGGEEYFAHHVTPHSGGIAAFCPRLRAPLEEVQALLNLILYGMLRFQRRPAYLQPSLCQALAGKGRDWGSVEKAVPEVTRWLEMGKVQATVSVVQGFLHQMARLLAELHIQWRLELILPPEQLCAFLATPWMHQPIDGALCL